MTDALDERILLTGLTTGGTAILGAALRAKLR